MVIEFNAQPVCCRIKWMYCGLPFSFSLSPSVYVCWHRQSKTYTSVLVLFHVLARFPLTTLHDCSCLILIYMSILIQSVSIMASVKDTIMFVMDLTHINVSRNCFHHAFMFYFTDDQILQLSEYSSLCPSYVLKT